MTDLSLRLEKTFNAPVEKVFNAWLNPETLSRFMTPMPGMPEPRTEVDAKEGGQFAIYMMIEGQEIPHTGEYLEISRHSKLVFTWKSPFSSDGSEVSILFSKTDTGGTTIDFSHVKFVDEEARNNHEGGWTAILNCLDEVLSAVAVG